MMEDGSKMEVLFDKKEGTSIIECGSKMEVKFDKKKKEKEGVQRTTAT